MSPVRGAAIVTGASRGIGAAVAAELARRDVPVVVAARSRCELDLVAARIVANGGEALAVPTDVGDRRAVERLHELAVARFGFVGLLVNNAAVIDPVGDVFALSPDDVRRAFDVNVLGAWHCLSVMVPAMLAAKGGRVVGISSLASAWAVPRTAIYAATKAAFERMHLVAAQEVADTGVTISVVWPGANDTSMQGRLRDDDSPIVEVATAAAQNGLLRPPEDTAQRIADLCEDTPSINGEVVDLDVTHPWTTGQRA